MGVLLIQTIMTIMIILVSSLLAACRLAATVGVTLGVGVRLPWIAGEDDDDDGYHNLSLSLYIYIYIYTHTAD